MWGIFWPIIKEDLASCSMFLQQKTTTFRYFLRMEMIFFIVRKWKTLLLLLYWTQHFSSLLSQVPSQHSSDQGRLFPALEYLNAFHQKSAQGQDSTHTLSTSFCGCYACAMPETTPFEPSSSKTKFNHVVWHWAACSKESDNEDNVDPPWKSWYTETEAKLSSACVCCRAKWQKAEEHL